MTKSISNGNYTATEVAAIMAYRIVRNGVRCFTLPQLEAEFGISRKTLGAMVNDRLVDVAVFSVHEEAFVPDGGRVNVYEFDDALDVQTDEPLRASAAAFACAWFLAHETWATLDDLTDVVNDIRTQSRTNIARLVDVHLRHLPIWKTTNRRKTNTLWVLIG